jgi:hypothetical protein
MVNAPPLESETPRASGVTQKQLTERGDGNIAAGFRQAEAMLADLRARGVLLGVFAIHFDEEREQLREHIEQLARDKLIERQRKQIETWTYHARQLAAEFADSGDWRHCRALLVHVLGMKQRLQEGGA